MGKHVPNLTPELSRKIKQALKLVTEDDHILDTGAASELERLGFKPKEPKSYGCCVDMLFVNKKLDLILKEPYLVDTFVPKKAVPTKILSIKTKVKSYLDIPKRNDEVRYRQKA